MVHERAFGDWLISDDPARFDLERGHDWISRQSYWAVGIPLVTFRRAVLHHAFRNSLIPLATTSADLFTVMFAGFLLLERVFDIDGMGKLFYDSILGRDYNVVMGIIVLTSVMAMLGRLFADILYVICDPRIRFN